MTTLPKITDIPKLNLPSFGREAIRAARIYAETGKFIPFLPFSQVPESPSTKTQLTDQERLIRAQEIIRNIYQPDIFDSPDPSPEPSNDLDELQAWFAGRDLPDHPVRLNGWTTLPDIRKTIAYHLEAARIDSGKPYGQIDLSHLREIKTFLEALERPP